MTPSIAACSMLAARDTHQRDGMDEIGLRAGRRDFSILRFKIYSIDQIYAFAYIFGMEKIRETFLALSDTTRLRALALMAEEGEVCVCELVSALGEVQPKISRHLAVLREAGIVTTRKDARWIHHTIAPGLETWAKEAVKAAVAGISTEPIHQKDRTRLKKMTGRPPRDKVA